MTQRPDYIPVHKRVFQWWLRDSVFAVVEWVLTVGGFIAILYLISEITP